MASNSSKQALEGQGTVGLVIGATSHRSARTCLFLDLTSGINRTGPTQNNEAGSPNADGDATELLQSLEEIS